MGSWVGLVVGVGGLLVAALSVVLAYRERSAGLRGALYEKQVEVYGRLLSALAELHTVAAGLSADKELPLDHPVRAELRNHTLELLASTGRTFTETVIFLPNDVADAIANYRNTVVAAFAPANAANPQTDQLTRAFMGVWEAMRHQLGTDKLSDQTVKLVGSPPLSREEGRLGRPTAP